MCHLLSLLLPPYISSLPLRRKWRRRHETTATQACPSLHRSPRNDPNLNGSYLWKTVFQIPCFFPRPTWRVAIFLSKYLPKRFFPQPSSWQRHKRSAGAIWRIKTEHEENRGWGSGGWHALKVLKGTDEGKRGWSPSTLTMANMCQKLINSFSPNSTFIWHIHVSDCHRDIYIYI